MFDEEKTDAPAEEEEEEKEATEGADATPEATPADNTSSWVVTQNSENKTPFFFREGGVLNSVEQYVSMSIIRGYTPH